MPGDSFSNRATRRRRPASPSGRKAKVVAVMLLSLMTVLVGIRILIQFSRMSSNGKPPEIAVNDWETVVSKRGSYSIVGPPGGKEEPIAGLPVETPGWFHFWHLKDGPAFEVSHIDLPEGHLPDGQTHSQWLTHHATKRGKDFIAGGKGTLRSQIRTNVGGLEGHEIEVETAGTAVIMRFCKLDNRVYELVVSCPMDQRESVPVRLFFNTFQVAKNARELAQAKPGPLRPYQPEPVVAFTEAELAGLAASLAGSDDEASAALTRLGKQSIKSPRDAIALALVNRAAGSNARTAFRARDLLRDWSTPVVVPTMIQWCSHDDEMFRMTAFEVLGTHGSKEGAAALAKRMMHESDGMSVRFALGKMGAIAEPAMIVYLSDDVASVRQRACEILGDVGTTLSKPHLERIAQKDPSDSVRQAASTAIAFIDRSGRTRR